MSSVTSWKNFGSSEPDSSKRQEEMIASLELQLTQIESRISRLTDAFIDRPS